MHSATGSKTEVSPTDTAEQLESRQRANTWPRRPLIVTPDHVYSVNPTDADMLMPGTANLTDALPLRTSVALKPLHKNPWGDSSYAELIIKAIDSSPEKRMTLAQIYSWIPRNIPYFEGKTIENAAGWKNSIRHNLSLHTCFYRGQNETPGRSSWWMIDPTAKPKKSGRPRTSSVGTVAAAAVRPAKIVRKCSTPTVHVGRPETLSRDVSIGEERIDDLSDDLTTLCDQACQTDENNSPQSSEGATGGGETTVSPIPESPDCFVDPAYLESEFSQQSTGFESWMLPAEMESFDSLFDFEFCKLWQGPSCT